MEAPGRVTTLIELGIGILNIGTNITGVDVDDVSLSSEEKGTLLLSN